MAVSDQIMEEILREVQGGHEDLYMIMERVADEHNITFSGADEKAICEGVDNFYFMCVCCGWWCEINEESDKGFSETVCVNCEDEY